MWRRCQSSALIAMNTNTAKFLSTVPCTTGDRYLFMIIYVHDKCKLTTSVKSRADTVCFDQQNVARTSQNSTSSNEQCRFAHRAISYSNRNTDGAARASEDTTSCTLACCCAYSIVGACAGNPSWGKIHLPISPGKCTSRYDQSPKRL